MSLFADAEEWQLSVGAQTWAGLAWGERDAPPALLLHGWLDNAGSFAPLARLLPGRRLWVPDLPGHGRSGHRPPGTWYHFVDYVSDVLALADALGLASFDLIGHSMGGAISTLVAASFPERIRKLSLIEALGPLARPADSVVGDLRRAIDARRFVLGAAGFTPDSIDTKCTITLEAGAITSSHLEVTAKVPGIDAAKFAECAADAKANCPISKLLNTEITMEASLS